MNPLLKIFVKNTASTFLFHPIEIVLGLVTFGLLIRTLGAERYGIIMLANTIIGNFNILDMGVTGGITKYIPQYKADGNYKRIGDLISGAAIFFASIGVIVCVSVSIFTYFGGIKIFQISIAQYGSAKNIVYMAALLGMVLWSSKVLDGTLRGFNAYHAINVLGFVQGVSSSFLLIFLSYCHVSLEGIFALSNLPVLIVIFLKIRVMKKILPDYSFQISRKTVGILKEIFITAVGCL